MGDGEEHEPMKRTTMKINEAVKANPRYDELVIGYLKDDEVYKPNELGEALNIQYDTLQHVLKRLLKDNKIHKCPLRKNMSVWGTEKAVGKFKKMSDESYS